MQRIPLINDLIAGAVPPGSTILVEFPGASQWYNACLAIAIGWLRQGGSLSYNCQTRPPEYIRSKLSAAGLKLETLEASDRLRIWDWYTASLGKKSSERHAYDSIKVADLSLRVAQEEMRGQRKLVDGLRIAENISTMARFNEEKAWVEFYLTRAWPSNLLEGSAFTLDSILQGVHSRPAYEQLEAAADGVIDVKVEEVGGKVKNLIRVRNMRDVDFDSKWHGINISDNFEVTLQA